MNFKTKEMETTIDMISRIEEIRPSLGLPFIFANNKRLGVKTFSKGHGLMLIANKSYGKGEVIKLTKLNSIVPFSISTDDLTPTFLIKYFSLLSTDYDYMEFYLEDLSSIVDNRALVDVFFNMSSKLIWDKEYMKLTDKTFKVVEKEMGKDPQEALETLKLKTEGINVLVGMTNSLFYKLGKNYEGFRSMWSDRFCKFCMLRNKVQNINFLHHVLEGVQEYNEPLINSLKSSSDKDFEVKISGDVSRRQIWETYEYVYGSHFERARGLQYFTSELSAHAILNDRDYITETDLELYKLFRPNLELHKYHSVTREILQYAIYNDDLDDICDELGKNKGAVSKYITHHKLMTRKNNRIHINRDIAGIVDAQHEFYRQICGIDYPFNDEKEAEAFFD